MQNDGTPSVLPLRQALAQYVQRITEAAPKQTELHEPRSAMRWPDGSLAGSIWIWPGQKRGAVKTSKTQTFEGPGGGGGRRIPISVPPPRISEAGKSTGLDKMEEADPETRKRLSSPILSDDPSQAQSNKMSSLALDDTSTNKGPSDKQMNSEWNKVMENIGSPSPSAFFIPAGTTFSEKTRGTIQGSPRSRPRSWTAPGLDTGEVAPGSVVGSHHVASGVVEGPIEQNTPQKPSWFDSTWTPLGSTSSKSAHRAAPSTTKKQKASASAVSQLALASNPTGALRRNGAGSDGMATPRLQVTVPAGMGGGEQLDVKTPEGLMQVIIPVGLKAGNFFELVVPHATDARASKQLAVVQPTSSAADVERKAAQLIKRNYDMIQQEHENAEETEAAKNILHTRTTGEAGDKGGVEEMEEAASAVDDAVVSAGSTRAPDTVNLKNKVRKKGGLALKVGREESKENQAQSSANQRSPAHAYKARSDKDKKISQDQDVVVNSDMQNGVDRGQEAAAAVHLVNSVIAGARSNVSAALQSDKAPSRKPSIKHLANGTIKLFFMLVGTNKRLLTPAQLEAFKTQAGVHAAKSSLPRLSMPVAEDIDGLDSAVSLKMDLSLTPNEECTAPLENLSKWTRPDQSLLPLKPLLDAGPPAVHLMAVEGCPEFAKTVRLLNERPSNGKPKQALAGSPIKQWEKHMQKQQLQLEAKEKAYHEKQAATLQKERRLERELVQKRMEESGLHAPPVDQVKRVLDAEVDGPTAPSARPGKASRQGLHESAKDMWSEVKAEAAKKIEEEEKAAEEKKKAAEETKKAALEKEIQERKRKQKMAEKKLEEVENEMQKIAADRERTAKVTAKSIRQKEEIARLASVNRRGGRDWNNVVDKKADDGLNKCLSDGPCQVKEADMNQADDSLNSEIAYVDRVSARIAAQDHQARAAVVETADSRGKTGAQMRSKQPPDAATITTPALSQAPASGIKVTPAVVTAKDPQTRHPERSTTVASSRGEAPRKTGTKLQHNKEQHRADTKSPPQRATSASNKVTATEAQSKKGGSPWKQAKNGGGITVPDARWVNSWARKVPGAMIIKPLHLSALDKEIENARAKKTPQVPALGTKGTMDLSYNPHTEHWKALSSDGSNEQKALAAFNEDKELNAVWSFVDGKMAPPPPTPPWEALSRATPKSSGETNAKAGGSHLPDAIKRAPASRKSGGDELSKIIGPALATPENASKDDSVISKALKAAGISDSGAGNGPDSGSDEAATVGSTHTATVEEASKSSVVTKETKLPVQAGNVGDTKTAAKPAQVAADASAPAAATGNSAAASLVAAKQQAMISKALAEEEAKLAKIRMRIGSRESAQKAGRSRQLTQAGVTAKSALARQQQAALKLQLYHSRLQVSVVFVYPPPCARRSRPILTAPFHGQAVEQQLKARKAQWRVTSLEREMHKSDPASSA